MGAEQTVFEYKALDNGSNMHDTAGISAQRDILKHSLILDGQVKGIMLDLWYNETTVWPASKR